RVHHAEDLYHALDLVETPERGACRREQAESHLARDLVALLHGELAAHLAAHRGFAVGAERAVAGDEEEVADADGADVVRHRTVRRGKRDVFFLEARFDGHRVPPRSDVRARASCHTARVSVKPAPAVPSPAATLVLLRDRAGGGVETLLIQRHHKSRFAAGDFVFPGGRVEPADNPRDAVAWCVGLAEPTGARRLGVRTGPTA